MKRIVKYSVMGETAMNLKQQLNELKKDRNVLLIDVNKINDGYKGKDATVIIEKYTNKVKELDQFIKNIENYQQCFEWLSGNYRDSHKKAKKGLETQQEELIEMSSISDLSTGTINLEGFGERNVIR